MTPQERAAVPVEVRQALADKVKNLIVSNLTHDENQLWLANVDAFEERAYQRGRRAALLEAEHKVRDRALLWRSHGGAKVGFPYEHLTIEGEYESMADELARLASEGG